MLKRDTKVTVYRLWLRRANGKDGWFYQDGEVKRFATKNEAEGMGLSLTTHEPDVVTYSIYPLRVEDDQ